MPNKSIVMNVISELENSPFKDKQLRVNQGTPLSMLVRLNVGEDVSSLAELEGIELAEKISLEKDAKLNEDLIDFTRGAVGELSDYMTNHIHAIVVNLLPLVEEGAKNIWSAVNFKAHQRLADGFHIAQISLPVITSLEMFSDFIGKADNEKYSDKSRIVDPSKYLDNCDSEEFKNIFKTGVTYIDQLISGMFDIETHEEAYRDSIRKTYGKDSINDTMFNNILDVECAVLNFLFYRGLRDMSNSTQGNDPMSGVALEEGMNYWGYVINSQIRSYNSATRARKVFFFEGLDKTIKEGTWQSNKEPKNVPIYQNVAKDLFDSGISSEHIIGCLISETDLSGITLEIILENAQRYLAFYNNAEIGIKIKTREEYVSKGRYFTAIEFDKIYHAVKANPAVNGLLDMTEDTTDVSVENYIQQHINADNAFDPLRVLIDIIGKKMFRNSDAYIVLREMLLRTDLSFEQRLALVAIRLASAYVSEQITAH